MTRGRMRIVGNAGMHLGAYMTGGAIEVTGNASDWVGGEMTGGMIRIGGNAGGQLGSAYRGSLSGMSGGTILVEGSAGIEIGMRMKRGLIAVRGPVRDFAGLQMKGGTILLMSGAEQRTAAWIQRGTVISLKPLRLLPTFTRACDYNPTFLRLYAKHLALLGFLLPLDGSYQRYTGDAAVPGKGEVLVGAPHKVSVTSNRWPGGRIVSRRHRLILGLCLWHGWNRDLHWRRVLRIRHGYERSLVWDRHCLCHGRVGDDNGWDG